MNFSHQTDIPEASEKSKWDFIKNNSALHWAGSHPVLIWSALFLLVRFAFLLCNDGFIFDTKIKDIDTGQIVFKEEFNNSSTARELLRGNGKMLEGLTLCGYGISGGEYYQVFLLTAVMKIFGDSYYAVKLVPIVFSFLIFLVLMILLDRYAGRVAAHIFAPLAIFSFPSFFYQTFSAMGNHLEASVFVVIGFACAVFLIIERYSRYTLPAFFLLGLTCGFGFFHNSLTAPFMIWLVPVGLFAFFKIMFRTSPVPAIFGALLFVLGLAIGFSPYLPIRNMLKIPLYFDLTLKGDLDHYGPIGMPGFEKVPLDPQMTFLETYSKINFTTDGAKFVFTKVLREMFLFRSANANKIYYALMLLMIPLFVLAMVSKKRTWTGLLIGGLALFYGVIHLLVLSASTESLVYLDSKDIKGYRYLLFVFPLLCAWFAVTLAPMLEHFSVIRKIVGAGLFLVLFLCGLTGFSEHFAVSRFAEHKDLEGFNYKTLAIAVGDYFREYPGPLEVQCEQIKMYLSNCDPEYIGHVNQAVDDLCAKGGEKLKTF